MDDPFKASELCLTLLNTVALHPDEHTPDALHRIITNTYERLFQVARGEGTCQTAESWHIAHSDDPAAPRREHAEGTYQNRAACLLAALPYYLTRTACAALRYSDRTKPNLAAAFLSDALADSCYLFKLAVCERPKNFEQWARSSPFLPCRRTLWDTNQDDFAELRSLLPLGESLGVKTRGTFNVNSPANAAVLRCIQRINWIQSMDRTRISGTLDEEIIAAQLPALSKRHSVVRQWWEKAIKPLLDWDRDWMLDHSPALQTYRARAKRAVQRAANRKDGSGRAKERAKAWNLFTTDCRQALMRIASSVTGELK